MSDVNILITGATGNVGLETIKYLQGEKLKLFAGVRNARKAAQELASLAIELRTLDFEKTETFASCLKEVNVVMLIRPPQISDVDAYLKPFIEACVAAKVTHIVFLSVQGVEKMSFIPHAKVEALILSSGISYTFVRPSYFMQNFLNDLHEDLILRKEIFLPAGKARFNLIDARDVAKVFGEVLKSPELHRDKAYEITGTENISFQEMAETLSEEPGEKIQYRSPNLLHFIWVKKKQGMPLPKILVMILLHYLPRITKNQAKATDTVESVFKFKPRLFKSYVKDYKAVLLGSKG